jgi:hypothetical protein
MYYWKFTTGLLFIFNIMLGEVLVLTYAWALLVSVFDDVNSNQGEGSSNQNEEFGENDTIYGGSNDQLNLLTLHHEEETKKSSISSEALFDHGASSLLGLEPETHDPMILSSSSFAAPLSSFSRPIISGNFSYTFPKTEYLPKTLDDYQKDNLTESNSETPDNVTISDEPFDMMNEPQDDDEIDLNGLLFDEDEI